MEFVASARLPQSPPVPREDGISVTHRSELILSNPQLPGLVSRVTGMLARRGIRILASSPYSEGQSRQWLIVVSDGLGASAILHAAGIRYSVEHVLLVVAPLRPAAVHQVASVLNRHHIDIQYSYTSPVNGQQLAVVFMTTDNHRALSILAHEPAEIRSFHA